jgi:VWFA-related protein
MDINKMFRLTAKTPFSGLGKRVGPLATLLALIMMQMGAAGTAPSPQEQGPVKLQQPLQYEVSVVLKLIHVYVTDKKGNPVRDLTRDDFTVTDNGQPVKLTDFEMHVLEAAPKEPVSEQPAEAAAPKNVPEAPAVRPASRKFFFFFDFAYNNARGIKKAQKAALHFLDSGIRPDDEVALLTYSAIKGMAIQEYLTTDHAKVRKVLGAIGQKDVAGRATQIEDQYWRLVQDRPSTPMGELFVAEATALRQESKTMAHKYMLQLTTLAKALRLIQGQKHFIFFSTGIPNSLIYGYTPGNPRYRGAGVDNAGDSLLRDKNEEMYKEFSAAGCAFYAFDTREAPMEASLFTYDEQTFATGSRGMSVAIDPTNIFKDDRATGLASLERLTDITGGKYYSNINRYEKNLDQVQSLTGTYYVLGYPISEQWDGQFHEVKVEVKRKGYEVRAQAGYFNPKPYKAYTDLEKELHLYDLALNERALSRMPVSFPMTVLSYAAGGRACLGILASIPGDVMKKFAGKRVEFVSIVFDGKGDIRDVMRLETDPGSSRGQPSIFVAESALAPGDYSCRLVIRDMDTGMSAVASAKRTVATAPPAGLELHTPLLLAETTGSVFLEAGSGKTRGRVSWTEAYPFDRLKFMPVAGEVPKSLKRVLVVLPYSYRGAAQPEFGLSGSLINAASGERMPVSLSLLEMNQNGPGGVLNLEMPMSGLSPGRYILYIHAEDKVSKAMAHVQTTFVVSEN